MHSGAAQILGNCIPATAADRVRCYAAAVWPIVDWKSFRWKSQDSARLLASTSFYPKDKTEETADESLPAAEFFEESPSRNSAEVPPRSSAFIKAAVWAGRLGRLIVFFFAIRAPFWGNPKKGYACSIDSVQLNVWAELHLRAQEHFSLVWRRPKLAIQPVTTPYACHIAAAATL